MKKSLAITLFLGALLPWSLQAKEPDRQALLQALAEGGKVVLMRHAATEEASAEVSMRLAGDCAQEQNLSAEGRAQAQAIAALIEAARVPVQEVISSEYCRARDTARIAFGGGEAWAALNLSEAMAEADSAFLFMDVEERMGDYQGEGNLVLISHRSNINILVFEQTEPADMVVLQPDGVGNVEVIGVLRAAD